MSSKLQELEKFIEEWQDGPELTKKSFLYLKKELESFNGVILDFKSRHGLTYSLRGSHSNQTEKPLFVMIDVIEGEPRWLSVCFYAQMISDPEERGDFVPQGLLGEDAICFDLEEYSQEHLLYLQKRIESAFDKASA